MSYIRDILIKIDALSRMSIKEKLINLESYENYINKDLNIIDYINKNLDQVELFTYPVLCGKKGKNYFIRETDIFMKLTPNEVIDLDNMIVVKKSDMENFLCNERIQINDNFTFNSDLTPDNLVYTTFEDEDFKILYLSEFEELKNIQGFQAYAVYTGKWISDISYIKKYLKSFL